MPSTRQPTYPLCRKLGLLRKPNGSDHRYPLLVSSSALYKHLGDEKYRAFIRHLHSRQGGRSVAQPTIGLAPALVEEWFANAEWQELKIPCTAESWRGAITWIGVFLGGLVLNDSASLRPGSSRAFTNGHFTDLSHVFAAE